MEDEDATEKIEDEDPGIFYEEFKTEVGFERTSGSMAFNTSNLQWRQLPQMPTPRSSTGAAHTPGDGEIVVCGFTETGDDAPAVDKAEIFLTNSSPLGNAGTSGGRIYELLFNHDDAFRTSQGKIIRGGFQF
nr:hypothetical transcript [Hymenolepis microstoma]